MTWTPKEVGTSASHTGRASSSALCGTRLQQGWAAPSVDQPADVQSIEVTHLLEHVRVVCRVLFDLFELLELDCNPFLDEHLLELKSTPRQRKSSGLLLGLPRGEFEVRWTPKDSSCSSAW